MIRKFHLPTIALLLIAPWPALAEIPQWQVAKEKSRIEFEGTQMGAPFTGSFNEWQATIRFDAENLTESEAQATIIIASIDATSTDRTTYAVKPDWLDAAQFPSATFTSTHIKQGAKANKYIAEGELTLRGKTLPITLPFTLKMEGDTATMNGETVLKRLDYGIGQGEWKDTSTVGDEIRVRVTLTAQRLPQ